MNPARAVLLMLGLAVFIFGVYLLFFEAGLDRWISVGVLTAGVVIFVGVLLMGIAGSEETPGRSREVRERERDVVRERPYRGPGGGGAAEERRYRR